MAEAHDLVQDASLSIVRGQSTSDHLLGVTRLTLLPCCANVGQRVYIVEPMAV